MSHSSSALVFVAHVRRTLARIGGKILRSFALCSDRDLSKTTGELQIQVLAAISFKETVADG